MVSVREYLASRAWLAAAIVLFGWAGRCASGPPPRAATVEGLAEALGASAGGVVFPAELAWEPSRGEVHDLLVGRSLLFLAALAPGQPRDLYRARVRLTPDGRPLSVQALRNLTSSPQGDETGLDVVGHLAVFATTAYHRVQAVSVLRLDGVPAADRGTGIQGWLARVRDYQRTGSWRGLGRTDVVFDVPTRRVTLARDGTNLQIAVADGARDLRLDSELRQLSSADGGAPYGARVSIPRQEPKPLVLWAVDMVRAEVGAGPIAWLENVVFGVQDLARRTSYGLFGSASEDQLRADARQVLASPAPADPPAEWPPAALPSIWQRPRAGEGEWSPAAPSLRKDHSTEVPTYFYRTYLRPDSNRPYSKLTLIAMDMRRLELRVSEGSEEPAPLSGIPGTGRLPADPQVLERVVGMFNGAFKTEHGQYGMMVDRRIILPPVPGAATVVLDETGRVALGSWPQDGAIAPDLVSFRQNLDPLVEDGVVNPSGRFVWGTHVVGAGVATQRTALCVTGAGQLIYAFGEDLDAAGLARGLAQARCTYAIHLDMNPGHCGFVFADLIDMSERRYRLEKASSAMTIPVDRYVRTSPQDFFYVLLRDSTPPPAEGLSWAPDEGTQPPPEVVPAIFAGTLELGDLEVRVVSFAARRFRWVLRAGDREPQPAGAAPLRRQLDAGSVARALAAIGMGHTTSEHVLGLGFHRQQTSIPMRSDHATLVISSRGVVSIQPPRVQPDLREDDDAVQLPLLADEGELTPRARESGSHRARAALCVADDGRVVVALVKHDSTAPAASVLLRVGCRRVVELERGSQHAAYLHRRGSSTPPVARYDTTRLYALPRPMEPGAYRWRPDQPTSARGDGRPPQSAPPSH